MSPEMERDARPPATPSFPALQVLALDSCHPLMARYLLLSIDGDRLHTLHVNCEPVQFQPHFVRQFFSEHFFSIINDKFVRLVHLELIRFTVMPGFIHENFEYLLLERLESLSLADLTFHDDIDTDKFLGVFKSQCKRLSVLNLRLQKVHSPAIVDVCIGLKNTLRKLHLLSHDEVSGTDESPPLSDIDAIQIIDCCKHLVSLHISRNNLDNILRSVCAPLGVPSDIFLTSAWVTHAANMLGTQLEHIGMAHLLLQGSVFEHVANQCLDLRSINLRKCNIYWFQFSEFEKFFERRGPQLESVDFTGCVTLEDRHLKVLRKHLSPSVLKTLRIGMLGSFISPDALLKLLRKTCDGLETLEVYGSATSVSVPTAFIKVIRKKADKSVLKTVLLERPSDPYAYTETLEKMRELQKEFPELLMELRSPGAPKKYQLHV